MRVLEKQTELDELKTHLQNTWMTGDYGRFSRYMERNAEAFYRRLAIKPGAQLLDVACGAGQLSLIAARSGARVTGCDIASNWLVQARRSAAAEGLTIVFEEGDAEALPYGEATFDAVVSLIGAMFAPRPALVAAEFTRVCRPGGLIAMANWTGSGFVGQMFKIIAKHIAPSGMPSPVLWGDEPTVRERFRSGVARLECSRHLYELSYPFSPADVVEFFRANYGPMTRAFASIGEQARQQLRDDLTDLWSHHNRATDGTTRVDAEYLQVVAVKGQSERGTMQLIEAPTVITAAGAQRT